MISSFAKRSQLNRLPPRADKRGSRRDVAAWRMFMKSFPYRCPNPKCRAVLSIPEAMRGQSAKCGNCSQEFMVPFTMPLTMRTTKTQPPPLRKAG